MNSPLVLSSKSLTAPMNFLGLALHVALGTEQRYWVYIGYGQVMVLLILRQKSVVNKQIEGNGDSEETCCLAGAMSDLESSPPTHSSASSHDPSGEITSCQKIPEQIWVMGIYSGSKSRSNTTTGCAFSRSYLHTFCNNALKLSWIEVSKIKQEVHFIIIQMPAALLVAVSPTIRGLTKKANVGTHEGSQSQKSSSHRGPQTWQS